VRRYVKFEENLTYRKYIESPTVEEDELQEDPKDDQCSEASNSRSYTSCGEEELSPFIYVKIPKWLL